MKEKVKAAPKVLVRRGLDDGTERLRGQLRETAQRGQASDYGGDRIEDTAARVAYQARRGVESLLKKKKSAKGQEQTEGSRTTETNSHRRSRQIHRRQKSRQSSLHPMTRFHGNAPGSKHGKLFLPGRAAPALGHPLGSG